MYDMPLSFHRMTLPLSCACGASVVALKTAAFAVSWQPQHCQRLTLTPTSCPAGALEHETIPQASHRLRAMQVQVLQQTVVALRLRHPNIVTVMGTSVDPPTRDLLLVTALLERGTLYDLLHNDTVSRWFIPKRLFALHIAVKFCNL